MYTHIIKYIPMYGCIIYLGQLQRRGRLRCAKVMKIALFAPKDAILNVPNLLGDTTDSTKMTQVRYWVPLALGTVIAVRPSIHLQISSEPSCDSNVRGIYNFHICSGEDILFRNRQKRRMIVRYITPSWVISCVFNNKIFPVFPWRRAGHSVHRP